MTTTHRVRHELVQFAGVSAYLYVCLGAMLLYKASVLHAQGIAYAFFGLAFVKALILGKFVLVGDALKIGGSGERRRLIWHIVLKSVAFMLLLVFLSVVEEAVAALMHGRTAREGISGIAGGSFPEAIATSLLVLLILVPFITWREISGELGPGMLMHLLLNAHSSQPPARSPGPVDEPGFAARVRTPDS